MTVRLDIFKATPCPERDAGKGVVGDGNRQAGGMPQHIIQIGQQSAAAGQDNALVHDIGRQFGRRMLQGHFHRFNDRANRLGKGFRHLALGDDEFLGNAIHQTHQSPVPEVIAGTLPYIAPEQTGRMNRPIDGRSDLYALGVTLYELFTGTLPFSASTMEE